MNQKLLPYPRPRRNRRARLWPHIRVTAKKTACKLSNAPRLLRKSSKLVNQCNAWEGTHGQLLAKLNSVSAENRRDPQGPKSAKALPAVIARAEPNLSVANIKFTRLHRQGGTGADG